MFTQSTLYFSTPAHATMTASSCYGAVKHAQQVVAIVDND